MQYKKIDVFKFKHLDWICAGPPFITNPDYHVITGHLNSINEMSWPKGRNIGSFNPLIGHIALKLLKEMISRHSKRATVG